MSYDAWKLRHPPEYDHEAPATECERCGAWFSDDDLGFSLCAPCEEEVERNKHDTGDQR